MELCSLEDAFPDIKKKPDKDKDRSENNIAGPSREERKAQRKRAKKCKGPALDYLNQDLPDPDRPALKRFGEIPAFTSIEDAYSDLSGSFEGFKLPRLPASNATFTDAGLPAYFGKGVDDDDTDIKGFSKDLNASKKEGFATQGSNLTTNTSESFEYVFGNNDKIPDPELNVNWKPKGNANANTAYFNPNSSHKSINQSQTIQPDSGFGLKAEQKRKSQLPERAHADPDSMRELMASQMKELERRMGEFEAIGKRDSKNEILMFVGTGLFLLVSFDLVVRVARG